MSALPRVFLHGWGQAPSVWLTSQLADRDNDILLSLPGHGGADDLAAEAWLDSLTALLPPHAVHLVGWSLGAMLALQWATRYPTQVGALTLYAATPCFCNHATWGYGVDRAQLRVIEASVQGENRTRGLARFTRSMFHGEIEDRVALQRACQQHLSRLTLPTASGLIEGLKLLRTLDLRDSVAAIEQPVTLVHGTRDRVVPFAAGQWLHQQLPDARAHWVDGYGHMPWKKVSIPVSA